ncbi:MAG: hypothetical protein RLZZ401_1533, partial [Pseudomonadota bacterium]
MSVEITTSNGVGTEGGKAIVTYGLSGPLAAGTAVNASVTSWTAGASDYSGFFYRLGTSGAWLSVSGGSIALTAGTTEFQLSVDLTDDHVADPGESVAFVVSQTATTVGISNSWWVQGVVSILDSGGGGGAPLTPVSISAGAAISSASEGTDAISTFNLSGPLGADADVSVSLSSWSAGAADYSGLSYSLDGGTTWSVVGGTGIVTLTAGISSFQLKTHLQTDSLSESNESVVFVVSQGSSPALTNSWWVTSQVNIVDPPVPTTFTGVAGPDSFIGTSGDDVFVIPVGTSMVQFGQFDSITGLGAGDKIDLPADIHSVMQHGAWGGDEASLI